MTSSGYAGAGHRRQKHPVEPTSFDGQFRPKERLGAGPPPPPSACRPDLRCLAQQGFEWARRKCLHPKKKIFFLPKSLANSRTLHSSAAFATAITLVVRHHFSPRRSSHGDDEPPSSISTRGARPDQRIDAHSCATEILPRGVLTKYPLSSSAGA